MCRKVTSSLFWIGQSIPLSAFTWTGPSAGASRPDSLKSIVAGSGSGGGVVVVVDDPASTLRLHSMTQGNHRGFCRTCGSEIYFRSDTSDRVSVAIGTVDALHLWGDGTTTANKDGKANMVPEAGFGRAIASGLGASEWCMNEIKGVTDDIPILSRGKRFEGNSH